MKPEAFMQMKGLEKVSFTLALNSFLLVIRLVVLKSNTHSLLTLSTVYIIRDAYLNRLP